MSGKGKITIIGGSVGGLFAGVLLSKAGFEVAVYERSSQGMEGRGAGLVAQREVIDILREIGCERVAQIGVVARERIFLDRQNQVIERHATPQTQISWDRLLAAFRAEMPTGHPVESFALHDRVNLQFPPRGSHFHASWCPPGTREFCRTLAFLRVLGSVSS